MKSGGFLSPVPAGRAALRQPSWPFSSSRPRRAPQPSWPFSGSRPCRAPQPSSPRSAAVLAAPRAPGNSGPPAPCTPHGRARALKVTAAAAFLAPTAPRMIFLPSRLARGSKLWRRWHRGLVWSRACSWKAGAELISTSQGKLFLSMKQPATAVTVLNWLSRVPINKRCCFLETRG